MAGDIAYPSDPNFLQGIHDPYEKPAPDTQSRDTPGGWLGDMATKALVEPVLDVARMPSSIARTFVEPGTPEGRAVSSVDRGLADAQKWTREHLLSTRQQAIDTDRWRPGPDDRSAWNEPVSAVASQAAPLVLPTVATVMTGGAALPVFGAMNATGAVNKVRDWVDNAPLDQLRGLEAFRSAEREFPGDEQAARDKLAKDSTDLVDWAVNFGAGVLPMHLIGKALTPAKQELGLAVRSLMAGAGGVEGGVAGAVQSMASETTQQRAAVKQGRQPDVDVAQIVREGEEGALQMAPGVAGLTAFKPGPPPPHDAHIGAFQRAQQRRTPPRIPPIDTEQQSVASQQLNEGQGPQGPTLPGDWRQPAPPRRASGLDYENIAGFGEPPPPEAPPPGSPPGPPPSGPAGPAGGPTPPIPPPGPSPAGPAPAGSPAAPGAAPGAAPAAPPAAGPTPEVRPTPPAGAGPDHVQTLYVSPDALEQVQLFNTPGVPRELAQDAQGKFGLRFTGGKNAGSFFRPSMFDASLEPREGLVPVHFKADGSVEIGTPAEAPAPAPASASASETVSTAPSLQARLDDLLSRINPDNPDPELVREALAVRRQIGGFNEEPLSEEERVGQLRAAAPSTASPTEVGPEQLRAARAQREEDARGAAVLPDLPESIRRANRGTEPYGPFLPEEGGGEAPAATKEPAKESAKQPAPKANAPLTADEKSSFEQAVAQFKAANAPPEVKAPSNRAERRRERIAARKQRAEQEAGLTEGELMFRAQPPTDEYSLGARAHWQLTPEEQARRAAPVVESKRQSPREVPPPEPKAEPGRVDKLSNEEVAAINERLKQARSPEERSDMLRELVVDRARFVPPTMEAARPASPYRENIARQGELKRQVDRAQAQTKVAFMGAEEAKLAHADEQDRLGVAIQRYRKNRTPEIWRQLKQRASAVDTVNRNNKFSKLLGPEPVTAEAKARAQPKVERPLKPKAGPQPAEPRRAAEGAGEQYGPFQRANVGAPTELTRRTGLGIGMNEGRIQGPPSPHEMEARQAVFKRSQEAPQRRVSGEKVETVSEKLKARTKKEVSYETPSAKASQEARVARMQETPRGRAELEKEQQEASRREQQIEKQTINRRELQLAAEQRWEQFAEKLRERVRSREEAYKTLRKEYPDMPSAKAWELARIARPLLHERTVGTGKKREVVRERLPVRSELPKIVDEYLAEHEESVYNQAAVAKTRAKKYAARETLIDAGVKDTVKEMGQDAFDGLLHKLNGEVVDAKGNVTMPAAKGYPKIPKELQKKMRQRAAGRRTVGTTTKPFAQEELPENLTKSEELQMKRVADYWKARRSQVDAARQLLPLLDKMIDHIGSLLAQGKAHLKDKSKVLDLPQIHTRADGTKVLRLTAGKGGMKASNYAALVNFIKQREMLKDIMPALDTAKPLIERDLPEAERYMKRLDDLLHQFVIDTRDYMKGEKEALYSRMRLRSAGVTEKFRSVAPKAGEDTAIAKSAEDIPETTEGSESVEDTFINSMDDAARRRAAMQMNLDRLKAAQGTVNDPDRRAQNAKTIATIEAYLGKHNGNRRNRPSDGDPPQDVLTARAEVDDARNELTKESPASPLISDPEEVDSVMERVKGLLGKSELSSFITPEFLDKLSRAAAGVDIRHAPLEVTRDANGTTGAFYQSGHDRIVLPNDVTPQEYAKNAVHETVHAATEGLLDSDVEFRGEVEQLRQRAIRYAERIGMDQSQRHLYGLADANEFLAEAKSNAKFRQFLSRVSTPTSGVISGAKNALNALYRAVRDAWRKAVGNKDGDTALDALFHDQSTVLGRTDQMVERGLDRLHEQGRPTPGVRESEARRYYPGQRFVEAVDRHGSIGKMFDRATAAWDNRDIKRGRSMSLHTSYDFTKRAEPEFQEKTSDVLGVMEQIHQERTRMLQEEHQPFLVKYNSFLNSLAPEWRRKVEDFVIDETTHRAYANEPLGRGRNKHISTDPDNLRDEQVRINHPEMQERYNELAPIDANVRDEQSNHEHVTFESIHREGQQFFADMERRIRNQVVRNIIERSDILPDTLRGDQRDTAIGRMTEYLFPERPDLLAMPTLDLRQWRTDERQRLKDEFGIDLSNRAVREQIADLRNEEAFRTIKGPYFPLTRHGDHAVYGTINIPTPANATRYPVKAHWQTGRNIDDGTFHFNTAQEAKDFVRHVNDQYGVHQLGGGEVYIDRRTGERAMYYLPNELEAERARQEAAGEKDLARNHRLTREEAENAINSGRPIDKKYQVSFQNKLLEYHDNFYDAKRAIDAWKAQHGDLLDINSEPEDVRKGTGKENERYVSQQMQRVIDRVENSRGYRGLADAEQAAMKNAMTLAAAKSVMRRGVRARFTPRAYVKGASHNIIRNMADYSGSTAGYLAKMKFLTEADRTTKAMNDYVYAMRGAKDHTLRTRVANALLEKMHSPTKSMVDNVFSRNVDRLLKFTMLDKLLGVGYFGVNATQPWTVGVPIMSGEHNPAAVVRELHNSYSMFGRTKFLRASVRDASKGFVGRRDFSDYKKMWADATRGQADEGELTRLYDYMSKRGAFEATAGMEYQRLLMMEGQSGIDKVGNWGSQIFQGANTAIENLSRYATASTAYRLARKKGLGEDAAMKYARDVMYETNGNYANFNTPELFTRNPAFQLMFQFRKYPQLMWSNYIRGAVGTTRAIKELASGKQISPENMARMRQFGMMLAMQAVTAGALGMPTEPISIPIDTLYLLKVLPFNFEDVQAGTRQLLNKWAGKTGGEMLSHGLLRASGLDPSGSFSQSDMIFYGHPGSTKIADLKGAGMGMLMGAGGGYAGEVFTGLQKASESARAFWDGADDVGFKKGLEAAKYIIPLRQAASFLDTVGKMSPEGMRTQSGALMRQPYTPAEAVASAVTGFRPSREAEQAEARRAVQRAGVNLEAQHKQMVDTYVQSSPVQQARLWLQIQQWNAGRPPEQQVTREELLKAQQRRRKAEAKSPEELGLTSTSRTRPFMKLSEAYNY